MEGYSSENPIPSPDKDGAEKGSEKKVKKESLADVINKSLESANKDEAAHKIADKAGVWERLTGKTSELSEEDAPQVNELNEKPEPTVEAVDLTPERTDGTIELPLDAQTRDTAREYIDLRADEVGEAQAFTEPESSDAGELGADATLLANAREQVTNAPDGSSFTEVIDTAYDDAVEAITAGAQTEAVANEETPAPAYHIPGPGIDPALRAEQEQAATNDGPYTAPEVVAKTEVPSVPWYYNTDGSRKFYPSAWPNQPPKSPIEKLSDDLKADKRAKSVEQSIKKDNKEKAEAIKQYIDTKEQAIRTEAAEIFAGQRKDGEPYRSAPDEKFMWGPAPKVAEAASEALQTAHAEVATSKAAERVQRLEHSELLAISEKVMVDGTSLRTIYEAKQITEPGLRRITDEYLRGGDVKHALEQELMVKQMTYERDPQMRDRLAASYAEIDAAAPSSASDALAGFHAQAPEPAKATIPTSTPIATGSRSNTSPAQQVFISVWAAIVVVLAIIAIVLIFR